jgi:uncharacterized protein GlcG (DUF336 family)
VTAIVRIPFSGSTNGRPIAVAAVSSPGTLIHTADATKMDEIHLFATNLSASAYTVLTVQFGGTSTSDNIIYSIPPQQGTIRILAGLTLSGGLLIKAYGDFTNLINISGYVNRIG